jgi:hypothetical protein
MPDRRRTKDPHSDGRLDEAAPAMSGSDGETPFGASAGSLTGVGGTFAAEAAALGVDTGALGGEPPPDSDGPPTPPASPLRRSPDAPAGAAGAAKPGGSGRA